MRPTISTPIRFAAAFAAALWVMPPQKAAAQTPEDPLPHTLAVTLAFRPAAAMPKQDYTRTPDAFTVADFDKLICQSELGGRYMNFKPSLNEKIIASIAHNFRTDPAFAQDPVIAKVQRVCDESARIAKAFQTREADTTIFQQLKDAHKRYTETCRDPWHGKKKQAASIECRAAQNAYTKALTEANTPKALLDENIANTQAVEKANNELDQAFTAEFPGSEGVLPGIAIEIEFGRVTFAPPPALPLGATLK